MKKIIANVLLWIFFLIIIFVVMFNYSVFKVFSNVDILLITSTILLFSGRIWTSFIFTFIYSFILDCVLMDFLGINLISYLLTLLFLFYLCENMNIENLLTKFFIILISCFFKIIIYMIFIILFYWCGKMYFIPALIFYRIIFTVVLGIVIFYMIDLIRDGKIRWQKMK